MPSVGIDLGTTNSCVAGLEYGLVKVYANEMGLRVTPSCVSFAENSVLVGDAAEDKKIDCPKGALYSIKRLIGRKFDDESVQEDMKSWQFEVINDGGNPKIRVRTNGETKALTPEEISGMVLAKMKEVAEEKTGKVYNAVVTVPAHFNDAQRRATMTAAKIANINVLRLLNEPTAAAIAYGFERKITSKRTVLVYDLGGGTFDVTLLTIEGAEFQVIGTDGDTHLGGDDFNRTVVDYLKGEFKRMNSIDIGNDHEATARLFNVAEKKKKLLSAGNNLSQDINVPALYRRKDLNTVLRRANFESLNRELFMKTFRIVDGLLAEKNFTEKAIDEVLLVGGSTRIPFIRKTMEDTFGKDKVQTSINPDEAVAFGAALYAAHLSGDTIPGLHEIHLHDVTPFSLGIEVKGEVTSFLIRRNSTIPVKRQSTYYTVEDNQTKVRINVYEGERARIYDNDLLGGFLLTGIPPMPAGEAEIEVVFNLNANGMLDVTAWEKTTGNSKSIRVKFNRNNASDLQVLEMRQRAEQFKEQDDKFRERVYAENDLEATILRLKRFSISRRLVEKCDGVQNWLKNNEEADTAQIVAKKGELEAFAATK